MRKRNLCFSLRQAAPLGQTPSVITSSSASSLNAERSGEADGRPLPIDAGSTNSPPDARPKLHHIGVGVGQREGCSDAASRADRAEQIGVVIALVGRLARSRSALGPLAHEAVLLADPGLVFKPYLDGRRLGDALEMSFRAAREVFLNVSTIRSS